ncbi:CPBP family intramembrane metalloprotease [Streptomyces nitrosporeus]|uniref:CPBP family intramembrane metalloprotease n=1 Tax=Streptomyces nitrosporeus TaxID=28894 RepID=A0A5J6FC54_9ACTN|nr:type II CAAX endopeptidase family protein [Streptomyces nitrosporeus]QEU73862.1 CPBP family intramembrane metalloprotease [Streptomyces nitrosporeus]GGZ26041.1 CAAX amino protease [Streptomyces nitrosporeus]
MRFVWQLLAVVLMSMAGNQAVAVLDGHPWLQLAAGLLVSVAAVFVYGWVVRRTEHRPPTEVARAGAVPAFGRGLLIGFVLFGAVITNIFVNARYEVDGLGSPAGAVGLFGFMAAAAVMEELLFRGVLFRITEERFGTWIAMALTAVLFGAAHLLNPNASLWGATAIAVEAGGMLAAAYVATRTLWLPIGLHFGWNFAAAGVFSTEVSGNDTAQGLLDATVSGPELITGGEFGPEGSVYAVLFGVLATVVFLWLARRRGRLVPLRGRAGRVAAAPTTLPR